MSKLFRILLCLLLVVTFVPAIGPGSAQAEAFRFSENFEQPLTTTPTTSGSLTSKYIVPANSTGTPNFAQIINMQGPAWTNNTDNKVLMLHDETGNHATAQAVFTKQEGRTIVAEFDYKFDAAAISSNHRAIRLLGGSTQIVFIETFSNAIAYRYKDPVSGADKQYKSIVPSGSFQAGTWYHMKIQVNLNNPTTGVMVTVTDENNHTYRLNDGQGFQFFDSTTAQASRYLDKLDHQTSDGNKANIYYDNVTVYEPLLPPAAPVITSTVAGNTQAALTWGVTDGATNYLVKRKEGATGNYEQIAALTGLYYEDTRLHNGVSYSYIISAVNDNGSTDSEAVQLTPTDSIPLPEQVTGLQAMPLDSAVKLSWNAVPTTNGMMIKYLVMRSNAPDGTYIQLSPDAAITETRYTDTVLNNDQTYYYKIIASSVAGKGSASEVLAGTPRAPLSNPTGLTAEAGDNKVALTWNGVGAAASYNVKRSTNNGGPYTEIQRDITGTSFVDASINNGTAYYYVVTAVNAKTESMISNQVKSTPYSPIPGAPTAPKNLTAIANEGTVMLSWNATQGATAYSVRRSMHGVGSFVEIGSVAADHYSYEDNSVVNGTEYDYVVAAVNAAGISGYSNEVYVAPAEIVTVDPNQSADVDAKRFPTISEAVARASQLSGGRKVVYIKAGTYNEKVIVTAPNISFIGEGREVTKIVYGDYGGTNGQSGNVGSTFKSQTLDVQGDNFSAYNLTVENNAGPRDTYGTAVAVSVKADKAIFDNVQILGYQDTLYNGGGTTNPTTNPGRQYFRNSVIRGDVDFIFGEAPAVVIENSDIISARHPGATSKDGGYVTAAAQNKISDVGYVFLNNRLIKDASAKGDHYLGRPWKNNPKVHFINTWMDSHIKASGWSSSWAGTSGPLSPSAFREFNSVGGGANAALRDSKISEQMTAAEASALTIPRIFGDWDPTQPIILPKLIMQPLLDQKEAIVDKNVERAENLQINLLSPGIELQSIANGSYTLIRGQDYDFNGSGYVIYRHYLNSLELDKHYLTFQYTSGAQVSFILKVINSVQVKTLVANQDGWASYKKELTGGAGANGDHIDIVTNRNELIQALGGNNATNKTNASPKVVFIKGKVDMNVDDQNQPLGYEDYRQGVDTKGTPYNYTVEAYVANPAALEHARSSAQAKQAERVKIYVGSNTTLIGIGSDAKIVGGNLVLDSVSNIAITNLEFQDAYDYFPLWDPADGASGNWNSQYDNITITASSRIWIDHNSFNDNSGRSDGHEATYFGKHFQHHDGFVDITNQSDLVTLSNNHFSNHDKTMLIGSSDSGPDAGRLRVTIHHNYFENIAQRAPRVRFGQVHMYNNYYNSSNSPDNIYSIGVGASSQVYSEGNYFENVRVPVAYYDSASAGSIIDVGSTFVHSGLPTWKPNGTWNPKDTYPYTAIPSVNVKEVVLSHAGAKGRTLTVPAPVAETGLRAEAGDSRVNLTWSTVTNATYYSLKRSTTSGGTYEVINPMINVSDPSVTDATYTDEQVINGTTYYYLVTAVGTTGEFVSWNEANATPSAEIQVPPATARLSASAGDGLVSLQWDSVTGATYYKVKRGTSSGGPYSSIADTVTAATYTDRNVQNGTTYYYIVTAVNSAGEGAKSLEVNAQPYRSSQINEVGNQTTGPIHLKVTKNEDGNPKIAAASVKALRADGTMVEKAVIEGTDIKTALELMTKTTSNASAPKIIVELDVDGAATEFEFPASDLIEAAKTVPSAELSMNAAGITYNFPLKLLDALNLANQLGADAKDVKLSFTIEKLAGDKAAQIEADARKNGVSLLSNAVDFQLTASANGKSVSIHDFSGIYVSRSINVNRIISPVKSTVVLYDPTSGSMTFVPATFKPVGGATEVTMKRPGNSIYIIVNSAKSFKDLDGHWAKPDVELLASKLVVNGMTDTAFVPLNPITRAEFAALLVRALGLPKEMNAAYSDVNENDWYAGAVAAAAEAGIINGFEDGTFKPNAYITREQAAVMIARALEKAGKKPASGGKGVTVFTDNQEISSYAKDAVSAVVNAGIINGMTDHTFVPDANASRAEAAVLLKRLLQVAEFID
ncbi:pectinesterase family protein [Paenibacillus sedimenti]|uniref:S-layer homology domain-containing protein n=1 Tax=Paenibacillus sedimenti TaxID=2770274 RepID=A0A926KTV2_9BACL|nr:pectinesterase family protein [Paenibacillus sedimenti]MBD0382791.1 S-layer homology domain-containing protein [Paenibacillus sedimenti]